MERRAISVYQTPNMEALGVKRKVRLSAKPKHPIPLFATSYWILGLDTWYLILDTIIKSNSFVQLTNQIHERSTGRF